MSTEKPRPLVGYRENQETKKDTPVDPKKFKEELSKVQESDATQQQGKRNLKKSEEEGEDDMGVQAPPAAPSGLFSMLMSNDSSDSLLTPKTPQNVRQTAAPTSSSTFNIEEMPSDASPPTTSEPPSASLPSSAGTLFGESIPSEEPTPPSTPSAPPTPQASPTLSDTSPSPTPTTPQTPTEAQLLPNQQPSIPETEPPSTAQPSIQGASPQTSPTRIQKKQVTDTSLLSTKHPSSAQLIKQKQEKGLNLNLGKRQSEPTKTPNQEKVTKQTQQPTLKQGRDLQKSPTTPSPIKQTTAPQTSSMEKEALLQKAPPSTTAPLKNSIIDKKTTTNTERPVFSSTNEQGLSIKTDTGTSQDHPKKQNKDNPEDDVLAPGQVAMPMTTFTLPPAEPLPAYTQLPSEVYELFERMVGSITVEQSKASTTTTITLAMKDSIFDGTQIILDRQSSSMNTFNIQIATNPQAQDLVNANLDDLVAAFQGSKLAFDVNIRKPILLEKYHDFQRKESPQKEKDRENDS